MEGFVVFFSTMAIAFVAFLLVLVAWFFFEMFMEG